MHPRVNVRGLERKVQFPVKVTGTAEMGVLTSPYVKAK